MIVMPPLFLLYELTALINRVVKDRWPSMTHEQAKKIVADKRLDALATQIERCDAPHKDMLTQRLVSCSPFEWQILFDLQNNLKLSDETLREILSGAHIFIADNGLRASQWKSMTDDKGNLRAHLSVSSHPSNGPQFRVEGELFQEFLFSTQEKDGKTYTWFQLESSPLTFGTVLPHTVDYFKYKITGKNQGPYGTSRHTHDKPIILSVANIG
jgi:hypothetical protein